MSKLSASLLVLVMLVSTLVFLPSEGGSGQTVKTNVIQVLVQDTDGYFVSGATVDLTNVHTGAVLRAGPTNPGLYQADNVPAGIYRVDVVAGDRYDSHTVIVNFTAYSSLVTPTVLLQAFDTKSHTWTVTLDRASDGSDIVGATVGFFDCVRNETVASATTNSTGVAVISMFTTQPTDAFVLYAKASGLNTTFEQMVVAGDGSRTWSMSASKRVTGYVKNWDGTSLLKNVVGYMISNDTSLPQIARILKSPATNGSFEFDAFPGDFVMVVDADNGSAYVSAIPISASETYIFNDFRLDPQPRRTEQASVVFGADFQGFTLSVDTNWSYDEAHPSLLFGDVGSLRLQIDLALGNGDGVVSQDELDGFDATLRRIGSQYVTSSGLVQVNDSLFDPDPITVYSMDLAAGSVISKAGIHYAYSCPYTAHGTIALDSFDYSVNLTARYDSYEVDYNYTLTPYINYELVDIQTSSLITVKGYDFVTIDPTFIAAGGSGTVLMKFENYTTPIAMAGVLSSAYAYPYMPDGVNTSRYIVAVNKFVNFTSGGSEDPNDNPLTFTWNFGDGSPVENTTNETIMHKYTVAAELIANLTVTDVVGMVSWSDVNITVDALVPAPVISVKDKDVNMTDNSILLNMREAVYMNGTDSTDDAVTVGDGRGKVKYVQFEWGDGNSSILVYSTADEQNMSHSYERAGTYTVVLNVTDVVGHWKNTTMLVKVNDTDAPTISLLVKNATYGTTLVENNTLILDANGTHDNVDDLSLLSFSWDFGDGTWYNATGYNATTYVNAWNVTHNYSKTGQITIRLNVTDTSHNSKVEARLITVNSGPRPKMNIDAITFDPETSFTEGSAGKILVNLTNTGSADATNIVVEFYIVRADGTQKLIGTETRILLNGSQVDTVAVGETVQVEFSYSPSSKGTYTIRVNVTCDDQLRLSSKNAPTLTVEQAAWKQYALWGGVAAVIILIPLLLYLRGRWAKREKKGPRREKKEKSGSEEEL